MKNRIFIFLLLSMVLTACIKEVQTDFNFKNKIVLFSYITDQDSISKVFLLNNQPSNLQLTNNLSYIEDATVDITDDLGNKTSLIFKDEQNSNSKFYFTDSTFFKFKEGVDYFISVFTPDGRSASAQMKIPKGVKPKVVSCDTSTLAYLSYDNQGGFYTMNRTTSMELSFDALGDYYFVYAYIYYTNYYKTNINYETTEHSKQQFFFCDDNSIPTFFTGEQKIKIDAQIITSSPDIVSNYSLSIDSINFVIISAEENYYKFLKSKGLQTAQLNDPFAEPAILYSNINNGLGIFTGLSVRTKTLKLK